MIISQFQPLCREIFCVWSIIFREFFVEFHRPPPPPSAALLVAAPCFCRAGQRPLAKVRPLPLLRFGCFVRRTRLSFAVPYTWEAIRNGFEKRPCLIPTKWDKAGPFGLFLNPYILSSHACGGTNGDRVQRTKQGAVSGAALRFLQRHSCLKQKSAKRKRSCQRS